MAYRMPARLGSAAQRATITVGRSAICLLSTSARKRHRQVVVGIALGTNQTSFKVHSRAVMVAVNHQQCALSHLLQSVVVVMDSHLPLVLCPQLPLATVQRALHLLNHPCPPATARHPLHDRNHQPLRSVATAVVPLNRQQFAHRRPAVAALQVKMCIIVSTAKMYTHRCWCWPPRRRRATIPCRLSWP